MTLRLSPIIDGKEDGKTIVFIQGWPDSAALWDESVAALAPTYRCVRVTLPNFDGGRSARWGYTTEEIIDALVALVRDAAKNGPVTLVLHDWGCYWGHPVHHRCPELVSRVVGLDISPHFKPSIGGALGIIAYQSWLYWAFIFGGALGNWMTRRMAMLMHMPGAKTRPLTARMNYPYRNGFADVFSGHAGKLTKGYWPTCPLLFLYGEKKPFALHSEKWIEYVKSVGGEVGALPAGHWLMADPTFVERLVRWLERTA